VEPLDKFIKFKKGNIPLILSVPHGGILECREIPTRLRGVLGIDKNTIKLTHDLIILLEDLSDTYFSLQKSPSYIISNVRRSKIDLNRIETEAYLPNSFLAKKLYQFYHGKITELIDYNLMKYNYSFLLDIHGFEKRRRPPGYRDVEIVLGTKNLATIYPEPVPIRYRDKNLRGEIIKRFIDLNVPIAPGHPRRREYILTGGYITQKYGVSEIPGSQTMQIEFSDRIRIYDKDLRNKTLKSLADVLLRHFSDIGMI